MCACQKSYTSIIMTSITWAGPRYVQELGTFFGPENRTQRRCDSSCSFLNFQSIPWYWAVEHVKEAKRMHNTDTLMDNMDIVSDAKWVTNLFYFTLLTIYTLVQVLQKPQTNQKCECFWCSSEFYRGFTRLNFQEF